jgi:hypothetical protein
LKVGRQTPRPRHDRDDLVREGATLVTGNGIRRYSSAPASRLASLLVGTLSSTTQRSSRYRSMPSFQIGDLPKGHAQSQPWNIAERRRTSVT